MLQVTALVEALRACSEALLNARGEVPTYGFDKLRDKALVLAEQALKEQAPGEGWVTGPILVGYSGEDPIGTFQIRKERLPNTPDYCFSIGFRAERLQAAPDGFGIPVVIGHTLLCLNLQDDAAYRAYLNSLHDGKTK